MANVDKKILLEKLAFWKEREVTLEKKFKDLMKLRGEAAAEGDLSENASFEMRTQDAQVTSEQLANVKRSIRELEAQLNANREN